jgi:O-antigen biosynthesis protein WbqV
MTRLSHLNLRNFLIALHDLVATTAALLVAFYLRFEGGDGFFARLPLLLRILPYFLAFSVVVFFPLNLATTKWRFISLPDALNIIRAATVLTVALLVLDYTFLAPNDGTFFPGKVTIVLYWFLEISFLRPICAASMA